MYNMNKNKSLNVRKFQCKFNMQNVLSGASIPRRKKKKKRSREVFAAFAADSPQTKSVNVKMPKLIAMAAPWIKLQETARLQAAGATFLPSCHAAKLHSPMGQETDNLSGRRQNQSAPSTAHFLGRHKGDLSRVRVKEGWR